MHFTGSYFKSTSELINPDIAEQLSAEWSGEDDAQVSKKVQCSLRDDSGLIDVAVCLDSLLGYRNLCRIYYHKSSFAVEVN
jgi:hypothetical protein